MCFPNISHIINIPYVWCVWCVWYVWCVWCCSEYRTIWMAISNNGWPKFPCDHAISPGWMVECFTRQSGQHMLAHLPWVLKFTRTYQNTFAQQKFMWVEIQTIYTQLRCLSRFGAKRPILWTVWSRTWFFSFWVVQDPFCGANGAGMPGIDWSKAKTLPGTPEGLAPGDHGIGKEDPENHVQTCFVGPFWWFPFYLST